RAVDHDGRARALAGDVVDPQRQLAPRRAAATGDAEAPVLLRRARVEDHERVAAALPARELLGVDGRDMVDHLDLLTEVLAGRVHAPAGGRFGARPGVDAAPQPGAPRVAHALEGGGGQRGAPPVVVADDDLHTAERHEPTHAVLEQPPRHGAGAGDVRQVVL